jgi:hypothetical protein
MLLLMIGAIQSGASSATGFTPAMDYWFIETLKVGDVELPAGVDIIASNPSMQTRGYMLLNNRTETLLYVMSLGYKDGLVMATPDPIWKARVSGAHEAASYLAALDRPAYLTIEALTDLDHNLVDRNVLSNDPPPEDVSVPAAQKSELLLVYGGQVIEVPFTLAYLPNTHFGNGLEADKNSMANIQATENARVTATRQAQVSAVVRMRNDVLLVGLAGTAVLLIAIWLVGSRLKCAN